MMRLLNAFLPRPAASDGLPPTSFRRQLSTAATAGVLLMALLSSLVSSWQASRQIRATPSRIMRWRSGAAMIRRSSGGWPCPWRSAASVTPPCG